jgi:hypothetical protein
MALSPSSTTFRDMVAAISPSWLQGYTGSRFMYSMAIMFDALSDLSAYAVRARFPDLAPPDAFVYLANDRQIEQGFQEPQPSYAISLTQWLDRWAHAGSPWGLIMAVRGFVSPDLCYVATINNNSVWDYASAGQLCDPSNPPTHTRVFGRWIWDSLSWPYLFHKAWWRVWVIITPSSSTWQQTETYSDGSRYAEGQVWGFTGTNAQVIALQQLVSKWKASNTWVPWVILSFDPTAFLPTGAGANPTGTWGTWSTVTANPSSGRPLYTTSRAQSCAYVDGVM